MISLTGHLINHTPHPFWNAVPATLISLTTSVATNFATRLGYWRPANYSGEPAKPRAPPSP